MHPQQSSVSKKHKSSVQVIICCYNIDQNESEISVEPQHHPFQKMPMVTMNSSSKIKFKNINLNNTQPIYELLNELYEPRINPNEIYNLLIKKRINPALNGDEERNDLEYFIPQIITFLVLERNLDDQMLIKLIINGCTTDFYFAHRVYFYLKSLSSNHQNEPIKTVLDFLNGQFTEHMRIYEGQKLSGYQFTKSMLGEDPEIKMHQVSSNSIQEHLQEPQIQPKLVDFKVQKKKYSSNGFLETPKFWDDLLQIGSLISSVDSQKRSDKLSLLLEGICQNLPADVYIPFFKDRIRLFTILNVIKGRIFSTKERAPYSVWMQIYREEEEHEQRYMEEVEEEEEEEKEKEKGQKKQKKKTLLDKFYEKISKPFSISDNKNTLNIKKFITNKISVLEETIKKSKKELTKSFGFENEKLERKERGMSISSFYEQVSDSISDKSSIKSQLSEHLESNDLESLDDYFSKKSSDYVEEMRKKSAHGHLKSWKMVHLMIKTGDDIKQEQFAMQLINRFQYIFKKEKIDCSVIPYEVVSLGPDCGVIEMLNDVVTLDKLFEKLSHKKMTLKDYFDKHYSKVEREGAKKKFMQSLAGYSLLTYFLQVKDRHNGNILLHRDGSIIHIDFGFFLSNAPGRGVELQKKVPFKLLSQYIEVIGTMHSQQFFEFRRLFYKGFSAILKNKDSILTIVKMMYSSHGEIMSCFVKGEEVMSELERRFSVEHDVESFCYNLINNSIDNWRAKWYDKFQYFLQKIYY